MIVWSISSASDFYMYNGHYYSQHTKSCAVINRTVVYTNTLHVYTCMCGESWL